MITGKDVFAGLLMGPLFAGGIYIGSNYLPNVPTPPQPFCIDDAQKVMARLRPLLRDKLDAYLYLWADGSVNITVKTHGSDLHGSGVTLTEAVSDLSRSGDGAKAALAGWKAEDAK